MVSLESNGTIREGEEEDILGLDLHLDFLDFDEVIDAALAERCSAARASEARRARLDWCERRADLSFRVGMWREMVREAIEECELGREQGGGGSSASGGWHFYRVVSMWRMWRPVASLWEHE